jgi:hypothetical protein
MAFQANKCGYASDVMITRKNHCRIGGAVE